VATIRPKGLLNIPELQPPSRDIFNIHSQALRTWIKDLPQGDAGESARRLFYAMKEINQYQYSNRDRWRAMEMLSPYIDTMTSDLDRRFKNQNLPMAEKNLKIAELCIELNRQLAVGYEILLDELWIKKLTVININNTVSIVYRALLYLYRVLVYSYEIYNDPPQYTWQHIHQLYLYAEDNQLTDTVPRDIVVSSSMPRVTIGRLYLRIVLLGLVSPFRLRQSDTNKIINALNEWSQFCKILPANQFTESTGQVLLKQNSDHAPGYYFSDKTINHVFTRTLDTSALIKHITDLAINHPMRIEQNAQIYDLPAEVIKLLILTWSGRSHRLFSRATKQNELTVSIGVNATHFMVHRLQNLFPSVIETGVYASLLKSQAGGYFQKYAELSTKDNINLNAESHFESAPVFGMSGIENAVADVWDDDYASKTIGYGYNLQIWHQGKENIAPKNVQDYQAMHCDNMNESANGYCLFSDLQHESNPTKVQIGELIGIYNDKVELKHDAIDFGIIRRLKNTAKGVELGIQKLSPHADAVAVCLFHKRNFVQPKFQRALLLPELKPLDRPYALVINKSFKTGDELLMTKLGFNIKIELTKVIETTAEFNLFGFDVKTILGLDADPPLAQSEQGDKFDTVWTLI